MKAAHNRPEVIAKKRKEILAYYRKSGMRQKHAEEIRSTYINNPEIRIKQSAAALRRYEDPAERLRNRWLQKIAQGRPETREKHSKSLLGKPKTEAHKAALRAAWVRRRSQRKA